MGRFSLAFSICILAMAVEPCFAERLVTDRPDQAESSETVGAGVVQLEAGALYEDEDAIERVTVPNLLLRIGLPHDLELRLGDPVDELVGRSLAVTHAPVPGFADRASVIRPVEVHPWPWLRQPRPGSVRSFSAWRKKVDRR